MAITIVAGWFLLLNDQFTVFMKSVVSILYFGSNYFFFGQTGYFDADIDLNPMVHTWSLAIEEQFYLFFPIVLWLVWRFLPKVFRPLVLVTIALVSFAAAATWSGDSSAAFYLLQFRAWELMVGALVAYLLSRRQFEAYSNPVLGIAGLVAIAASVFFIGAEYPHPGFVTLLPVLGTGLVIATSSANTIAGKFLSWKPFVWIGLISYSTYLWHQPIFSFYRVSQTHSPAPEDFLPLIALALAIAYLSWYFIENPIRNRKRFSRRFIFSATAVATVLVLGASFSLTRTTVVETRVAPNSGIKYVEVENDLSPNLGLHKACKKFVGDDPRCATGENPTALLWGDSYAMSLADGLKASPTKLVFSQQTLSACAPLLGFAHQNPSYGKNQGRACIAQNDKVFKWLSAKPEIKLVILASPWDDALNPEKSAMDRNDEVMKIGTWGQATLRTTIQQIRALGKHVVVVSPQVKNTEDTGMCLVRAKLNKQPLTNCNFPAEHNQLANVHRYLLNVTYGVGLFDLKALLCQKICVASIGQTFIYRDYGHFTKLGSALLGKSFDLMGQLQKAAR
jgi:peptidoglycan/LPS O-acetylase OafA/YrhL